METDQRWTWWTCYFTHFLIPCWLKKWRNLWGFFLCCPPPVGVVVLKWAAETSACRRTSPLWLHQSLRVNTLSGWGPLSHCLNLSHFPLCERWPRGFNTNDEMSACVNPLPHFTQPSAYASPHDGLGGPPPVSDPVVRRGACEAS